jgi:hypothetical protein
MKNWFRYAKPETGRGLDDDDEDKLRSTDDLKTAMKAKKRKFHLAKRATD